MQPLQRGRGRTPRNRNNIGGMVKRITFKTGPLKGKTYDIPTNTTRHDLAGGWYDINGDTTTWRTNKKDADTK